VRLRLAALVWILGSAGSASVAAALDPGSPAPANRTCCRHPEDCRDCQPDCLRSVLWSASLTGGAPLRASAAVTAVIGDVRQLGTPVATGTGLLLGAELGPDAAGLRAGAALLVKFRRQKLPSLPLAGIGVSAAYVHLWNARSAQPNRNYVGPELQLTGVATVRVGWLFPITETDRSRAGRFTWRLGVGF